MSTILENLKDDLFLVLESHKPRVFKSPHQNLIQAFEQATQRFKQVGKVSVHIEYQLVQKFLEGRLDNNHASFDLLGDMILVPIDGNSQNTIFLSNNKLKLLLNTYRKKIAAGEQLQITWKALFQNFLKVNNQALVDSAFFEEQLELLRNFLEATWTDIKNQSESLLFELRFIDRYPQILAAHSWEIHSKVWLDGLSQRIIQMGEDLEIPQSSWFWYKLFSNTLHMIVHFEDDSFKKTLPHLILLLEKCPAYQDTGITLVLDRFSRCQSTLMHTPLMEFITRHWGPSVGPKDHESPWHQISDESLRIVQAWHHERNLRIFFALKTGDKQIAQQKLDFWLRYLNRIEMSRLALGSVGQKIVQSQSSLKRIFHPQTNPFSKLSGDVNPEQNAIILKIDNKIVIDFIVNDGCFIYDFGTHTFDLHQETHYATTYKGGLKERYGKYGVSISENQDWSDITHLKLLLQKYGI